ncbi:MAG: hypothetical protein QUS07_02525 [Methanothrix sp.]|nr:hypothetical protein [Methanothrix sp.]
MPTVRVSDRNWRRLQHWAIPLEDTVDDALTKVLDAAELAKEHGLIGAGDEQKGGSAIPLGVTPKQELERQLNELLESTPTAFIEREGKTMIRWRSTEKSKERFWVTTNGSGIIYLPRRGKWSSDVQQKVTHYQNPKSGWERYDRLLLQQPADVPYAIKILHEIL